MKQSGAAERVAVLFVCLGNICRSPTAEAILRKRVAERELAQAIRVDSAGTGDYHIGEAPDSRAIRAGRMKGYALESLRARQVAPEDYGNFDYILAMDQSNLRFLQTNCPDHLRSRLRLMLDFSDSDLQSVPDPYWGGDEDFADLIELLEPACEGLLRRMLADLRGRPAAT